MSAQPVRVCFLIDDLNNAGTEIRLLSLIRDLDRKRVLPYLCLLRGNNRLSRALLPDFCPVVRLGLDSLFQPLAFLKIVRLAFFLWYYKIDVLQMYFPDSSFIGFLAGIFCRVPHLVRTRNNLGYSLSFFQKKLNYIYNYFFPSNSCQLPGVP